MLSIFVDFIIIVFFASVLSAAFFIAKRILYPEESKSGELTVRTEVMPKKYENEIAVGDVVFDTLTKRRVGTVTKAKKSEKDGGVYFILTLDSSFRPRSRALRTKNVWFYFAEADI